VQGYVAKFIDNKNMFHMNETHYRQLTLDFFKTPILILREMPFLDGEKEKKFPLHGISQFEKLISEDLRKRNRERKKEQRVRSKSTTMGRILAETTQAIDFSGITDWKFGFEITI
jgi:hypothetical protein